MELAKTVKVEPNPESVRAARGLTEFEAETAFALSLVKEGRFSPKVIAKAKSQMIRKSGLMEFWQPADINSVGGLENLKSYIRNRADIQTGKRQSAKTKGRSPCWGAGDRKIALMQSDCDNTGLALDRAGHRHP